MKIFYWVLLMTSFGVAKSQYVSANIKSGITYGSLGNKNYALFPQQNEKLAAPTGFAGLSISFGALKFHSLETGFYVNTLKQKRSGVPYNILGSNPRFDSELNIQYFEIPVMYRFTTKPGIYFEAGGSIGIQKEASMAIVYNSTFVANEVDGWDATDQFKNSMGASFGLGYDIHLSNHINWHMGLRYNYGLTDVKGFDNVGTDFSNEVKYPDYAPSNYRVLSIEFGIGYYFGEYENEID